jgi:protein arginine kinase activator
MAMKCDVETCENEATVHLTEIRDGVKHEMHLCERCAAEKGLPGKAHFSFSELLAGIASQAAAAQAPKTRRGKEVGCPVCATTLSQFQASGRFGCPECYATFRDEVQGLVEKINDSSQHVGKVPKRISAEISLQKDIRQWQVELKRAVRREDYEKAAAIRDQIRLIEERLKKEELPAAAAGEPAPPALPASAPFPPGHAGKKKPPEGGKKGS